MDNFADLTMVDPPEPSDWEDEPTTPYGPKQDTAKGLWCLAQDPLKLTRVG